MKLFSSVCLVLLLSCALNGWVQSIDGKAVTVPPVENPGFETCEDGFFLHWGNPLRVNKAGEYGIDTAEKHGGSASYRIHADTAEGWGYITGYRNELTEIKGGGTIRLRVWAKGENLAEGPGWVALHWTTKDGGKGSISVKTAGKDFGWKEMVSSPVNMPEGVSNYFVQVGVGPKFSGTVWFDDIAVECAPEMVIRHEEVGKTLVGYWNFDEGTGTEVHDQSGYGNDGTVKNPGWEDGIKGKCLFIEAPDSYVEIPHSLSLSFRDNVFTIEAWVKPEDIKSHKTILCKGNLNFACWQGKLRKFMKDDYLGISLKAKEWNHLVLTYDSKTAKIYRNGLFYGAWLPYRNFGSRDNLFIGCFTNHSCMYSGCIDEVKIYNRVLEEEEIRKEYAVMTGTSAGGEERYTPHEKEQCRRIIGGLIKPDKITDASGAPAYRKNLSLFLYNDTGVPMDIGKVEVNGLDLEETEKTEGKIVWHVVTPPVIPSGTYGEITVRYWDADYPVAQQIDLAVWNKQGDLIDRGGVEVGEPGAAKFRSVGFTETLDEVCVYLQAEEALKVLDVRCNGKRVKFWSEGNIAKNTVSPLLAYPEKKLEEGTHFLLDVVTDKGSNSVLMRASRPFFPVSIHRCFKYPMPNTAQTLARYREMFGEYADGYMKYMREPGEKTVVPPEWLDDCRRNHFNTFLGDPWVLKQTSQPAEEILRLLKEKNMRLVPLHDAGAQEQAYEGLLYYGLADEPNGIEHARKLIEKLNRLGKEAPKLPSSLVFCNLDSNPCDYTYVDRASYDVYPIGPYAGRAPTYVGRGVKELSELMAPKPVGFVVQAFRANPTLIRKRKSGWCRFPFPEEERLMVYSAVANGAREMSYFSYALESWESTEGAGTAAQLGIPEAVKLWEEIGNINMELSVLGPWLSRGCPVKQQKIDNAEISYIAVGKDTQIIVLINTGYSYVDEKFVSAPKDFILPAVVPPYLKIKDVFEFSRSGISDLKYTAENGEIKIPVAGLKTSKIIVITADSNMRNEIAKKRDSLAGEF